VTGDLAQRKVLPALYHLFAHNLVHEHTYIVGTSRSPIAATDIINNITRAIRARGDKPDPATLKLLKERLSAVQLDPVKVDDYKLLGDHLNNIEEQVGSCLHRLFYLSIPPQVYGGIVERLGEAELNQGCPHHQGASRLLVEKPFGYDVISAEELIADTGRYFDEEQIFRIDHYLAQETARNILTFRSKNPLFRQAWNNEHITKIVITAAEKIGIEGRANFYEQVGALRDLIQSHLLQLLCLVLMDIPETVNAQTIHAAKQQVFAAIEPIPPNMVAERAQRGQYQTYREEVQNPHSTTETYASVTLFSNDPAWKGVPLTLTTGKSLTDKHTSITVHFGEGEANQLQFRIQPDEGITLGLQVKKPGLSSGPQPTSLDFTYQNSLNHKAIDAYERVLVEALRGDHTLFATSEEVMLSWRILQPLIDEWGKSADDLAIYPNNSAGPAA
jgi:glucose-6-phosphate 1-dehydrogenase